MTMQDPQADEKDAAKSEKRICTHFFTERVRRYLVFRELICVDCGRAFRSRREWQHAQREAIKDWYKQECERARELADRWHAQAKAERKRALTAEARARELEAERDVLLKARFSAPIVCMCGSTRFKETWLAENARLTSEGYIVLSVGVWGHHERVTLPPEVKAKLDDLHKRKIDLCDWVWILDVGGYIGESTRSEIAYAEALGKPVRYLSREFPTQGLERKYETSGM